MATKKYLSLDRLTEYDALLKAEINAGDESTLSSSKAYTDEKVATAKSYTDTKISNMVGSSSVSTQIENHNTSTVSHGDIRELITDLTNRLNALANSDDTTLDQMAEIVEYIKSNRTLIDSITTSKINVSDIVDDLTTSSTSKVLSAKQGVAIKALIDVLQTEVDGKAASVHTHAISDVTNLQTTLDGKADSSHNHSASNITSGTLSSSRLPTVPLTKGGTGATSASSARTNLSVYSKSEVDTALTGKSDTSHAHNDIYYTEVEIDEKLVVFDDRIVATEENTITDVINIFTPADAGKFLCVAEDGSIKAVAFTDVSEVGA